MNAKEAAALTAKELPNAIARAAVAAAAEKDRQVEMSAADKKKADKAFDERYTYIETCIESACKEGKTECRVNIVDDEACDRFIAKLVANGFKADIGDNSYRDFRCNNDGCPDTSNQFWHKRNAYFISWGQR